MNKAIYVLTASLLASQVHAQLLQLGTAANVDAAVNLGGTVQGATQAIGAAAGTVRNTAAGAAAGARASLAAPPVDVQGRTDTQVRTQMDTDANASAQAEPSAQAGTSATSRAHAEAPGRAEWATGTGRQKLPAARGAAHAKVQSETSTSVEIPRIQGGAGVDARLSGSIQGR